MTKKHYLQIILCTSLVIIASVLFSYYYKEYIAPESYTIGTVPTHDYTELSIADYFSDDDVIFSQNINAMSFANEEGTATYICNFDAKEFNGLKNSYIIYVNEHLVNDIKQQAGQISGVYKLNYLNVDSSVLCSSNIKIDFAFYSLASKLQITLPFEDISYLYNYFKSNNFIVTLAINPFTMQNKDGEVDEKLKVVENIAGQVTEISTNLEILEPKVSQHEKTISDLLQANEDKTSELNVQKTAIQADKNKNSGYLSQLETLTSSISQFETTNANLLEADSVLKEKFDIQKTKTSSLTTKAKELETRLNNLIGLIDNYSYEDEKITITFMVKDKVYKIASITKNSSTSVENPPENDEYQFNYWEVEGSKIDLSSYTFTKNTIVTANITKKIVVNYYVDDNDLLESKNCLAGNLTYFPKTPTKHCKIFKGWSLDKQNVLNDFNFDNDVSLYAVYDFAIDGSYTITFPTKSSNSLNYLYLTCKITFDIKNGEVLNGKLTSVKVEVDGGVMRIGFDEQSLNIDFCSDLMNEYDLSVKANIQEIFGDTPLKPRYYVQLLMNFDDISGEWELLDFQNPYVYDHENSPYDSSYTFQFERNQ